MCRSTVPRSAFRRAHRHECRQHRQQLPGGPGRLQRPSLYLTDPASGMIEAAQATAQQLELDATHGLTPAERQRLIQLLQKVYRS